MIRFWLGICKGLRPKISEDIPKLLADLIMKCWDAKVESRPTAKELDQILNKWNIECGGGGYEEISSDYKDEIVKFIFKWKNVKKLGKILMNYNLIKIIIVPDSLNSQSKHSETTN